LNLKQPKDHLKRTIHPFGTAVQRHAFVRGDSLAQIAIALLRDEQPRAEIPPM